MQRYMHHRYQDAFSEECITVSGGPSSKVMFKDQDEKHGHPHTLHVRRRYDGCRATVTVTNGTGTPLSAEAEAAVHQAWATGRALRCGCDGGGAPHAVAPATGGWLDTLATATIHLAGRAVFQGTSGHVATHGSGQGLS
mmetsp:Transcript_5433/g.6301  ORF Transcript_5433/g.6301 Transcript_5433/m.6301 type:complete len:139 (-) Transcript_5433:35-451(-)